MISIRQVKPDEWQKLCSLNKQIFVNNPKFDDDLIVDFVDTESGQAYFRDSITSPEGVCLVAEEDGVWLGYTNGNPKDIPYRHSKYFEIENLGVIPEAKGKGVGKLLLQALVDWAKQKGFQKIYLVSYIKNQEAIGFYHHQGFQDIDLSMEKVI